MTSVPSIIARREFKNRSGIANFAISPLHVSCENPECQRSVSSDMKWTCGYCDFSNRRSGLFSFLNKCQECGKEPKAYLCPRCQEINFLDSDKNASNPARLFVDPDKGPPKKPQEHPRAKKRRAHNEQLEDIDQEIAIEERKARLSKIKEPANPNKNKSSRERLKERILASHGQNTDLAFVIREILKEETEKYKDDPDMIDDIKVSLDSIKSELLNRPQ